LYVRIAVLRMSLSMATSPKRNEASKGACVVEDCSSGGTEREITSISN
jgi:hypothetical protein